jgi:hypothetical protein
MARGSGRGCFVGPVVCRLACPPPLVSSPPSRVSPPRLPCLSPPLRVVIPPTIHPTSSAREAGGGWCIVRDVAVAAAAALLAFRLPLVSSRLPHLPSLPLVSSRLPRLSSRLPRLSSRLPRVWSGLPCLASRPSRPLVPPASHPPFLSSFHPPATPRAVLARLEAGGVSSVTWRLGGRQRQQRWPWRRWRRSVPSSRGSSCHSFRPSLLGMGGVTWRR